MSPEGFLAVILMLPAVESDLLYEKVENGWILFCAGLLAAMRLIGNGPGALAGMAGGAVLPVLLLWPLFRIRAIGAGDCKMLAALGLLLGPAAVLQCMVRMFLLGGVLAAALLAAEGTAAQRFRYLRQYVKQALYTRTLPPYRESGARPEHIHMTVPMLMSVFLWAGGI